MILLLIRRWLRNRRAAQTVALQAPSQSRTVQRSQSRRTPRNDGLVGLVLHQARYELLGFLRNRQARFFTVLLPILFLVIFVSVFGNDIVGPRHVKAATYYVPGLAAMAVVAGSFVNLVISVTTEREQGILKRRRATPVPAGVLIAGRAVTAMAVSLGTMAITLIVGRLAYGVQLPTSTIPAVMITALVGSLAFCVLGFALTSAIQTADGAQPMVQAIMLPLYFISGVFIPNVNLPEWLRHLAEIFPVQHLANGLHNAFDPAVTGNGIVWNDIAVLGLWAAAGLLVALRRFTWVPVLARG